MGAHPFYIRMASVFRARGSSRSAFCRQYSYAYNTLQSYWNTEKLPHGNVIHDLCLEYGVSADFLLFGKPAQNTKLSGKLHEFLTALSIYSDDQLGELLGATRMYIIAKQIIPDRPPIDYEDEGQTNQGAVADETQRSGN